jgi:HK97 family phage major capsid protein
MSDTMQKEWRDTVAELKDIFHTDVNALKAESSEYKERFERINEKLDSIELEVKKQEVSVSPEAERSESVAQFKQAFADFAQGNRSGIGKDIEAKGYHPMLKKSDNMVRFDFASTGALLIPETINQEIIRTVTEVTPLMGMARMTNIGGPEYKRRVRTSTPGGNWLAEEVANTKGKPTYATVNITPHKWAASYGWTIENQQDSQYNLVAELLDAFREDSEVDFGNSFLNGDGVGKPFGMLGRIDKFESASLALDTDMLIKIQESRKEPYQDRAEWLMTRKTRAYVRTLVLSSTNGLAYTWEPDFQRRGPTQLLGNPVRIAREGDLAGRFSGDFTAGQVPIVYGDFRSGYEIVMRSDNYIIDDPYTESSAFVRNFHIMTRLGANVIKPEALVELEITAAG